jgi:F-type H+-transporting ATPase subunit b
MKHFPASALIFFLGLSAAQAASEAHGHDEAGIPTSLIFSGINFFILVGILIYFLKRPIKEFFASRSTLIRTTIEQAQDLKANAEKRFAEYEGRLKSIDRERRELIASLKEGGELEKRRLVETARRQAEMLRDTQQKFISQELRKAKEELKKEAVVIAAELAEKLLRENLTPEDQNRLVGQYVERMEKLA